MVEENLARVAEVIGHMFNVPLFFINQIPAPHSGSELIKSGDDPIGDARLRNVARGNDTTFGMIVIHSAVQMHVLSPPWHRHCSADIEFISRAITLNSMSLCLPKIGSLLY